MKDIKKSGYATLLAIVILIIVGYNYDYQNSQTPVEYVVSTIETYDKSPKGVFRRAWRVIKNNYVDDSLNHQDWARWKKRYEEHIETHQDARVAIDSMLASLNDPYTRFLPKREFDEQNRNIDAKLQGIGVHITEDDGITVIVSVIDDTPAQKYGLKKDDKIIQVDFVSTKGLSLHDVAMMIRGERGTSVTLTILRDKKVLTKQIVREEIKIKTVKYEILDNNVAYIRILSFISSDTANEFRKALIATGKADAIIVDVRGNFGGLLSNAVYISNMFIRDGTIVSTVDRNGDKKDIDADRYDYVNGRPFVILVDESSASASEIFSGAMKDHKKAILVGKTTFGKGRVQMIKMLQDGSGINFTIAKYLTPAGIDIDHKGIEPDYEVESEGGDFLSEDDAQFMKAKELIFEKLYRFQ